MASLEVFDVLFYMDAEGQSYDLRQTPLKARLDFLAKIVVPREHWLECAAWLSMTLGPVSGAGNRHEHGGGGTKEVGGRDRGTPRGASGEGHGLEVPFQRPEVREPRRFAGS